MQKENELKRLEIKIDVLKEKLSSLEKSWNEAVDKVVRNKAKGVQCYGDNKAEAELRNEIERTRYKLREAERLYNGGEGVVSDDDLEALADAFVPGTGRGDEDDPLVAAIVSTF